jgi:hypothetical protein
MLDSFFQSRLIFPVSTHFSNLLPERERERERVREMEGEREREMEGERERDGGRERWREREMEGERERERGRERERKSRVFDLPFHWQAANYLDIILADRVIAQLL